jgi:hypothetical protein
MKSYRSLARTALLAAVISASLLVQRTDAGVLLAPGGFAASVAGSDPGAGALLASTSDPFANSVMSGTLISSVYAGDPFNAHGGLTFTYQFTLDASSTHSASEFTVASFDSFLTDLSYNPAAFVGGVAPTFFSRSSEGGSSGQVLRFGFFGPSVGAGMGTALLVVQTDAHLWTRSIGAIIDGQAVNVNTLAPTVVPEPGTAALVIAGFGIFFLRLRRNR